MNSRNADHDIEDDLPGAPLEQSEPDLYLPGTPTVSFLQYVRVAVRTLLR
jgi:hypothetical protein